MHHRGAAGAHRGRAVTRCSSPVAAAILEHPHILLVEDEMLVAMMLEDMLTALGCSVVKAARVGNAVKIATTAMVDAAVLDVNVAGESVYPVADALPHREIPFIVSTGYSTTGLRDDFRDRPTLSKPFRPGELRRLF